MIFEDFKVGQRVRHRTGDLGTVTKITDEFIHIKWDGFPDGFEGHAEGMFYPEYLKKHPDFISHI